MRDCTQPGMTRSKRRHGRFDLGAVPLAVLVTACVSGHPPYPQGWPRLGASPRGSFAHMAGSYDDRGERGQMSHIGPAFLSVLPHPWTAGLHQADTVSLAFPDASRLDIGVHAGTESAGVTLSRKAGHFTCKGGRLTLKTPIDWQGGLTYVGPYVGGDSVELTLEVVNGYLYATLEKGGAMWLPVPMRSTWSSWYRFRRHEHPSIVGSGEGPGPLPAPGRDIMPGFFRCSWRIMAALPVLLAAPVMAQMQQGSLLIGGTAGVSSSETSDFTVTDVNLKPMAGFFVIDRLALGAVLGVGRSRTTSGDAAFTTTTFSVEPTMRSLRDCTSRLVVCVSESPQIHSVLKAEADNPAVRRPAWHSGIAVEFERDDTDQLLQRLNDAHPKIPGIDSAAVNEDATVTPDRVRRQRNRVRNESGMRERDLLLATSILGTPKEPRCTVGCKDLNHEVTGPGIHRDSVAGSNPCEMRWIAFMAWNRPNDLGYDTVQCGAIRRGGHRGHFTRRLLQAKHNAILRNRCNRNSLPGTAPFEERHLSLIDGSDRSRGLSRRFDERLQTAAGSGHEQSIASA